MTTENLSSEENKKLRIKYDLIYLCEEPPLLLSCSKECHNVLLDRRCGRCATHCKCEQNIQIPIIFYSEVMDRMSNDSGLMKEVEEQIKIRYGVKRNPLIVPAFRLQLKVLADVVYKRAVEEVK